MLFISYKPRLLHFHNFNLS